MDDFYVTLTSHTNSKYYENSLSNFTNKLASRISLKGNWEVGLSSISLTNYWLNLTESTNINFYYYEKGEQYVDPSIKIPKSSIVNIEHFIKTLNSLLDSGETKLKSRTGFADIILSRFHYDKKTEFVFFNPGSFKKFQVFPDISQEICDILGFKKENIREVTKQRFKMYDIGLKNDPTYTHKTLKGSEKSIWADNRYNLLGKFHSMFVYCSIIKESHVGEQIVPLLRCIETPLDSNYGGQIALNFENPQYIPVRTKEIDNIEIKIKDEDGAPFPFEHGRVILTLHFRKKKQ